MIKANTTFQFIIALLAAFITASCTKDNGSPQPGKAAAESGSYDSTTVKIAVMPTLDCLPLFVADSKGLFIREGLDVALLPFTAQMDCDTAIAGGSVDGLATDLVRAERLQSQGTKLRYVAATELQWQLLTSTTARIKQLKQLDDKMLAMTRYSATALIADMLVDSAKLATERVFRIQVNDVQIRLNMLQTGVMDAMLLPEPQATVARLLPATVVYDTATDTLRLGTVAFSEKALALPKLKDKLDTFTKVYNEACDSITERGIEHYRDIVAQYCHVASHIADTLAQQHPMTFPHAKPPRQSHIDRAKAWLNKTK